VATLAAGATALLDGRIAYDFSGFGAFCHGRNILAAI